MNETTGTGTAVETVRGRADFAERQEARRERLESAAAKTQAKSDAAFATAKRIADVIPFGQPILVGHHSEKRARRDADRIRTGFDRSFALAKEAKGLARRVDAVGDGGISSDDPQAVTKLREQLTDLTRKRDRMKASNVAARKAGTDQPFEPFQLSNLGANIRRIEKRIAELSAAAPSFETVVGSWYRIEARADLNRIALTCDRRTSAETYAALRAGGWRWSPTEKAFLVGLHNRGIWAARQIVAVLNAEVAS